MGNIPQEGNYDRSSEFLWIKVWATSLFTGSISKTKVPDEVKNAQWLVKKENEKILSLKVLNQFSQAGTIVCFITL